MGAIGIEKILMVAHLPYKMRHMRNSLLKKKEAYAQVNWKPLLTELLAVLPPGLPVPEVKIINTKSKFLGQCVWMMGYKDGRTVAGNNTRIELQKVIMVDEQSCKRILAHELCHHADDLLNERPELLRIGFQSYKKLYGKRNGHGAEWRVFAEMFNAKYGKDFVTKYSDENIVKDDSPVKPFFVLMNRYGGQLRWAHADVLSVKMQKALAFRAKLVADGKADFRLVMSTDPLFRKNGTPLIGSNHATYSENPVEKEKAEKLWNQPNLLSQYLDGPRIQGEYYVLMGRYFKGKLAWQHARTITPIIKTYLQKIVERNMNDSVYRLFKVEDPFFFDSSKISPNGTPRFSRDEDEQARAEKLWSEGTNILPQFANNSKISAALAEPSTQSITDSAQPADVYVVFKPNQVKSAIGNNGDFNPKSRSITAVVSTIHGLPDNFETYLESHGGLEKFMDGTWEYYEYEAKRSAKDEGKQWNSLSTEEQNGYLDRAALDDLAGRYDQLLEIYNSFSFPLKVYRAVALGDNDISKLDTEGFGVFWTWDIDSAAPYGLADFRYGNIFIFEGVVQPNDVDWDRTMRLNLDYNIGDEEKEIRLKPKAKIRILGYKRKGETGFNPAPFKMITASPDFGYTEYNDKESWFNSIEFDTRGVIGGHLTINAIYNDEVSVGFIECSIHGRTCSVEEISIGAKWRGTGLGQMLYDAAIAEAKKAGLRQFTSDADGDMQPDAHSAWRRLMRRYPVQELNSQHKNPAPGYSKTLYSIDLGKAKIQFPQTMQASKVASPDFGYTDNEEGSDFWERVQRDLLDGIVYHGTTLEIAELINKEGFRGLEWDEILKDVLNKHNMTEAQIPKKMLKVLNGTKRSYEDEMHLVSTAPGGNVAVRWAGSGGEVPRQIEAYITGKYLTKQVTDSRLKGDPAVVKCRIKNFKSTPHYERAKRMVDGMNRLITDGGVSGKFTPKEAADDLWHSYTNFHCKPDELEVLEIITGEAIRELTQHPLGVSSE